MTNIRRHSPLDRHARGAQRLGEFREDPEGVEGPLWERCAHGVAQLAPLCRRELAQRSRDLQRRLLDRQFAKRMHRSIRDVPVRRCQGLDVRFRVAERISNAGRVVEAEEPLIVAAGSTPPAPPTLGAREEVQQCPPERLMAALDCCSGPIAPWTGRAHEALDNAHRETFITQQPLLCDRHRPERRAKEEMHGDVAVGAAFTARDFGGAEASLDLSRSAEVIVAT